MVWIAGVDGFKSRWCVVLQDLASDELRVRIVPTFAGLLSMDEAPKIVAVDIPIGLPEYAAPGGRDCEREARRLLGRRASSVFSAVGRAVLHQPGRSEANIASRAAGGLGVGAQAWGLAAKLREADAAMWPHHQGVVHEVHPEVSFWAMNDGVPISFGKKSVDGERVVKLLSSAPASRDRSSREWRLTSASVATTSSMHALQRGQHVASSLGMPCVFRRQ